MGSSLVRWLAALNTDRLAEVLARRPDCLTPPPRDLSELARRLQARDSVTIALQGLPLPAVQLVEVLQSIGGPAVTGDQLAAALGRTPEDPEVDATLSILAQRALVWSEAGALRMAGPLWSAFPYPLGLGAPAQQLLRTLPAAQLCEIAKRLGVPNSAKAISGRLAGADAVRAIVESAPGTVRKLLMEIAFHGPTVAARHGLDWALERGLLVHDGWRHAQMPAEVARALRGPQWRPRFDPRPPEADLTEVEPEAVDREAAAAAGTAIEQITTLLGSCASTPVGLLKSGGVGVRELRRLSRTVGCGEPAVRLWLELAYAAGLMSAVRDQVLPTEEYDAWCAAEPAGRLVPLLTAWLHLPAAPLVNPAPDGAPPPAALTRDPISLYTFDLRPQVLGVAAEVPPGYGITGAKSVESAMTWRSPLLVGAVPDGGALIESVWREAELLGVVAHGALTSLGKALLDETLPEVAEKLLPAAVRTAMFQADLTAVVPGVPAAELAALLDLAADRESRGGATTWRFGPASVRRALDSGLDSAGLLAALREYGELPQPLEYLIGDVARRHGAIRVRAVGCVLHADDPALLAEVASARALAALRLTLLAPTVLASASPVADTLTALRAAGYAPVGESADGTARIEKAPRQRARATRRRPPPRPRPQPPDPHEIATALRTAGSEPGQLSLDDLDEPDAPEPIDGLADAVLRHTGHLSRHEQATLLAALGDGTPIEISYTNAEGVSSVRVIEPVELNGRVLIAWCRRRRDERAFALDRIESVAPA